MRVRRSQSSIQQSSRVWCQTIRGMRWYDNDTIGDASRWDLQEFKAIASRSHLISHTVVAEDIAGGAEETGGGVIELALNRNVRRPLSRHTAVEGSAIRWGAVVGASRLLACARRHRQHRASSLSHRPPRQLFARSAGGFCVVNDGTLIRSDLASSAAPTPKRLMSFLRNWKKASSMVSPPTMIFGLPLSMEP